MPFSLNHSKIPSFASPHQSPSPPPQGLNPGLLPALLRDNRVLGLTCQKMELPLVMASLFQGLWQPHVLWALIQRSWCYCERQMFLQSL